MKPSPLLIASTFGVVALASWAAPAQGAAKTDARTQAAIVTALALVNGYADEGTWVLVQHSSGADDTHTVSIFTKTARNMPEATSTNEPPSLLARVTYPRRRGAEVEYPGAPVAATGNEEACRAAAAYTAQQGWLTSGFWMHCVRDKDQVRVFFSPVPNRWPGDHHTIMISKSGLRFIGGA